MIAGRSKLISLSLIHLCLLFPATSSRADDDALWTRVPTRIDRSKQHFERLPAVTTAIDRRAWLVVPPRIMVLDSARFTADGKTYHIADIRPVNAKRLCKSIDGGRWGCGRMGSILLGNLVRDKRLLCDVAAGEKETVLNNCLSGKTNVAREILSRGFGWVDTSSPLIGFQLEGQAKAAGLWRNPDCKLDVARC